MLVNVSKNHLSDVSEHIDMHIFTAIDKIRKNSKRPNFSAIFKKSTKTQATNFKLKYVEDIMKTLIRNEKVINDLTATGLCSFFLKRGGKLKSETMISKPSPFSKYQNYAKSIGLLNNKNSKIFLDIKVMISFKIDNAFK